MTTSETPAAPRNTEEQLVRHCCAELAEFDKHFYRPAHTVRMGNDDVQWRFCPWCGKPLPNNMLSGSGERKETNDHK